MARKNRWFKISPLTSRFDPGAKYASDHAGRGFAQSRPHRVGVHAGALGIRGGFADWDLFVFVISERGTEPACQSVTGGGQVPTSSGRDQTIFPRQILKREGSQLMLRGLARPR